jgi:hypothetical protein
MVMSPPASTSMIVARTPSVIASRSSAADKEASMTTTAEWPAAAKLEANKAVIGSLSTPGTAVTSTGWGP